ncbi:nectin cell adhesion molecule 1a isoform X2 [Hemibagrus wyckioides]|uniref:nectin cell adhesion molecule 1a isoform X2 n=1 Tax=Hemibagrus wyckioides TaxID=337641 RepID=UPI00266D99B8|nr:nectin cell adhesion molecule 1a isoform X2 [Hemibagrus wyckioides]
MFTVAFQFPLIAVLAISGVSGQTVHTDSDRSGYVGTQVELRCHFANSKPPVKISQVTWQKSFNGTKQNVAIANPSLGVSVLPAFKDRVRFKNPAVRLRTTSLEDTTIFFNNLKLSDEATYICEYTTFPAGNRESMVNLTVYARPMIQMSLSTPTIVAGSKDMKMTVATCVSANGKPPAVITWDTELDGEANTEEIRNADGTITVRSDYIMTPSREAHEQRLTCISTYNNDQQTDNVILNIQYEPDVSIEGFDGNWYINRENVQLSCLADANPAVSTFQWRFLNGSMPSTAEQRGETLIFKGPVTYEMTGTYMCDATNSIGTGSASVEVIITETPQPLSAAERVMGVLGWVIALGIILSIAAIVFVVSRQQRKKQSETDSDSAGSSPARKKPSSFKKKPADDFQNQGQIYDELPNPADYVSYRLACNKDGYPEQHSPPIQPPLTFLPQHPCPQSNTFTYPTPPGPNTSYTFPKEQYV